MPTTFSFSSTTELPSLCRAMCRTATSSGVAGATVHGARVIACESAMSLAAVREWASISFTSRSLIIPTNSPSSVTGRCRTAQRFISRFASASDFATSMVSGERVITSCTSSVWVMRPGAASRVPWGFPRGGNTQRKLCAAGMRATTYGAGMSASAPFKSEAARERYLTQYALRARAWPVPSEERVVPTSFGQTFVRVSGPVEGAPVLMLPGIGSPGLSLAPLMPGLSGPLRTYVIDNIHDVGRSVERKVVASADDFAAWLDEVRLGLGLGVVDLLGLSYGGWICAQYALRFPALVRRVVLLAPAGTTAPIPWGFIWRAVLCLIPARYFMRNFMAWVAPELRAGGHGKQVLEEMVEDAYLATRSFASRKMVPPLPLTDEQWGRYGSKTLFLAGDDEVIFPPHEALVKLAKVAPHVEATLIPGAGHDFFVVRAEEVSRRVVGFLG